MDCFIKKEYWINRQVQIYKKTPDAEVIRPWIWRFLCALRRTFLRGEIPKSALVVGRIQPKTRPAKICQVESQKLFKVFLGMKNRLPE